MRRLSSFLTAALVMTCLSASATNLKIAKNHDNSLLYIGQKGAIQYCASHHSRLPSARELAVFSVSLGAKGLRDTAYPQISINDPKVVAEINQNKVDGFFGYYARNTANELTIFFYLNSTGYKGSKEFNSDWFWSSSTSANPREGLLFNGIVGDIEAWVSDGPYGIAGVACLSERAPLSQ